MGTFKIAFGGKLAEQLTPAMQTHKSSSDIARQELARKFFERETISRGGGVQCRVQLTTEEVKYFLNDVTDLYKAHAGIEEILDKASRNRLVGIQANRTKKKLESVLANANA
jgi:hypothetical protein